MTYDLLQGVRVIEVSMYAFAPSAAAVLADWGAEVIKVVPPQVADPMMGNPIAGLPDTDPGVSFMWELLNRGKRCVGLDLSTQGGRAVLEDLVAGADVFLTNLLPNARARYHIDPDDLATANPSLIYARATAHGHEGPERDAGGYDHTDFWARAGIGHAASQVTDELVPQPGPAMGDLTAGASMAGAIAAALYRRATGRGGAVIDVSLLSSAAWVGAPAIMASQLYDIETIPRVRHAASPNALVGAYRTADDRLIYLAGVRTDGDFDEFCALLGNAGLATDERFDTARGRADNRAALIAELDTIFAGLPLDEWVSKLRGLSTPWTIVQSAREAGVDQQVLANNYVTQVSNGPLSYPVVASPAQFDGKAPSLSPAPAHGEHTEQVLLELGRSWDEIIELKATDAVL